MKWRRRRRRGWGWSASVGERRDALMQLIGEALGLAQEAVETSSWDSMARLTLVLAFEERFALRLTTREILALTDVAAFEAVLERRGAEP